MKTKMSLIVSLLVFAGFQAQADVYGQDVVNDVLMIQGATETSLTTEYAINASGTKAYLIACVPFSYLASMAILRVQDVKKNVDGSYRLVGSVSTAGISNESHLSCARMSARLKGANVRPSRITIGRAMITKKVGMAYVTVNDL